MVGRQGGTEGGERFDCRSERSNRVEKVGKSGGSQLGTMVARWWEGIHGGVAVGKTALFVARVVRG